MNRQDHMPASIKQALVDGEKPRNFYGKQQNRLNTRKRSATATKGKTVLNMLKRIGL